MNKMNEKILVVTRRDLFENDELYFNGVTTDVELLKALMDNCRHYIEVRRGNAEENDAWKQPIPYAIIKRGDEVFLYKRLKAGGEARLHDQLSVGVGGHMNSKHGLDDWDDLLIYNMYKELNEELNFDLAGESELEILGMINDDSNEVSAVHIGILAILNLSEDSDISVRETDKLDGHWVRIQDLKKTPLYEGLESWSQLAVEVL